MLKRGLFWIWMLVIVQEGVGHPGQVLQTFPSPSPFPTGLAWDGTCLWIADHRIDRLSALDPSTGQVIRSLPSPGFWPIGLAWDGKTLWNVDQKQNKLFRIDPRDGTILAVLESPGGRPEGLTWDGEALWLSDSRDRKIYRIDPTDGTAVHAFPAPGQAPQGLAWDGAYLWCADRLLDEIHMIDPRSGEVLLFFPSPGPYPRGLAWDGKAIWTVDYQTDTLYRLVRDDGERYRLSNPRKARMTLTHAVKGRGLGKIRELHTYLALPEPLPQQKIFSVRLSPDTWEEKKDRWGQRFAHLMACQIPPESTVTATLVVDAEISEITHYVFPDRVGSLNDIPRELRERYTANGSKYQTDSETIRRLARKAVGSETRPYWMVRRIFDFVRESLDYQLEGGWNSAPVVLERGTGSCSEYTFAFIALCRAVGIPARYVGSVVIRGDDASLDDVFHRWAEVFLPGYGWIPVDPQGGDKPSSRDRALNFGHLPNRFLITTIGGGDSEYLGWTYNAHETYCTDPQVEVQVETFAEWEPLME